MKPFTLLLCLISLSVKGHFYHFEVVFNKKDSGFYSTSSPSDYLSAKSILRKTKHSIPITIEDFPITKNYLDSLDHFFNLRTSSKWFNMAVVETNDSLSIDTLKNFSFVSSCKFIGKKNISPVRTSSENDITTIDYGSASAGINLVKGEYLHDNGYLGEGFTIAVLDAGFSNVNSMDIFTKLFDEQRVLVTKNIVTGKEDVYEKSVHGTQVLSVLAGNKGGEFVGSAPKASYILLVTEDVSQENLMEEYFWVQGAEYADSLGADIISSSLGYNTFDTEALDHTKSQIGASSTMISQGARKAVEKGILVVNSAGNEGDSPWVNFLFPADEEYVLTVGAVDEQGNYAAFSSTAPNDLNFVKPNVVALGEQVSISSSQGNYTKANGTSFACPIISGLAACLWQAHPNYSQFEIKEIIETSAHQYNAPDHLIGYGIPNFSATIEQVSSPWNQENTSVLFPNPTSSNEVFIEHQATLEITAIYLYDKMGMKLKTQSFSSISNEVTSILFPLLSRGSYIIRISTNEGDIHKQLIVK